MAKAKSAAPAKSASQLRVAAEEVAHEWRALVETFEPLVCEETPEVMRRALRHGFITLDRSLIMFLCGGESFKRDPRDIGPADFLGRDWFPPDEEMDQRLRGRLKVMSGTKSHLSWSRVLDLDVVMWSYKLLVWETSWSMGQFVAELRAAQSPYLPEFASAQEFVTPLLPPREFGATTSEYGPPRPGQADRQPVKPQPPGAQGSVSSPTSSTL